MKKQTLLLITLLFIIGSIGYYPPPAQAQQCQVRRQTSPADSGFWRTARAIRAR